MLWNLSSKIANLRIKLYQPEGSIEVTYRKETKVKKEGKVKEVSLEIRFKVKDNKGNKGNNRNIKWNHRMKI